MNRESHGLYKSVEYRIWAGMKQRCNNPRASHYDRYGGRGIRVCREWDESFLAFYEYMGPRPSRDLTIERIDNNGDYEPGNVRWATRAEQMANRNLPTYPLDGMLLTVRDIASHIDVDRRIVDKLLLRGNPIEEIVEDIVFRLGYLYNPKDDDFSPKARYIHYEDRTWTLSEFAEHYQVNRDSLYKLLTRRGLSDQMAGDIITGRVADPNRIRCAVGDHYGMLTIVSIGDRDPYSRKVKVVCDCDCGNKNVTADLYAVASGYRTHCGCQSVRNRVASRRSK